MLQEALPGVVVGHAASGDAARLLLGAEPWDLLVLDLDLGGASALRLLRQARAGWPGLPVLALGTSPGGDGAGEALRLGAAGYLPKSAPAAALAGAARVALAGGARPTPGPAAPPGRVALLPDGGTPAARLSARELEVVRLVARGRTARQAAEALGVSEKTVATYRARLAAKLGLSRVVELTRYAHRQGLLDP